MSNLSDIGDKLVDQEKVKESKHRFMLDAYESYKRANSLLGYFSQLRDYKKEYDRLLVKVNRHRSDILIRYQDVLTEDHHHIFKQMLVSPVFTKWYNQGINQYKKVKNYSLYYYRKKLFMALEEEHIDLAQLKKVIDTIIALDKYYDIYDETIEYMMQTSSKFDQIMRRHFSDCIHI